MFGRKTVPIMHQFVVLTKNKDDRVISHNEKHRFPIFSSRHLPPTDASVNAVTKTTLKIIYWLNNVLFTQRFFGQKI